MTTGTVHLGFEVGTGKPVRRPWVTQGITIPRFSDKHDQPLKVTIALDVTRAFLAKFEGGGAKTETAAGPIAIPSTVLRPSVTSLPPLSLYPKNLGLAARRGVTGIINPHGHVTRRGVVQLQLLATFAAMPDAYEAPQPCAPPGAGTVYLKGAHETPDVVRARREREQG